MSKQTPPKLYLYIGLIWWLIALTLSLFQAQAEGVHWNTPYGIMFVRTLIVPILFIIAFFVIAIRVQKQETDADQSQKLYVQILLLLFVAALSYWASTTLLRPNWVLLVGVWTLLPLLYLAQTRLLSPNTLISLGSIVGTLIVLEAILHAYPQVWPDYARQNGSNWRRIHADVPSTDRSMEDTYHINQIGFRGIDPVPERVEIVALGDSFTFGQGAAIPWPEHLSMHISQSVLNLGMSGTDTPHHVMPLVAFGVARHPRYVIEAYFEGNDLYNCYMPANPQGPRWGDHLILPDFAGSIIPVIRRAFRQDTITSALTYDIVTPLTKTIAGRDVLLTFSPAYAGTLTLDRSSLLTSENWRIVSNSLLRMRDLSHENSSRIILVYLPERTHVYWPIIRDDEEILEALDKDMIYKWEVRMNCLILEPGRDVQGSQALRDSLDLTIDVQRDLLAQFTAENDIPFLDLTEPLRNLALQGITLAAPLDTHYNDFVNQEISKEIADFIEKLETQEDWPTSTL